MQPAPIDAEAHADGTVEMAVRAVLFGLAVALAVSVWPTDARAVGRVARTADGVLAMSGTRENDFVSFFVVGGTYEFHGSPALRAGEGCLRRARYDIACAGDGVTGVTFATGPGRDEVRVSGAYTVPAEVVTVPIAVSAGPGDDKVHAGYRLPVVVGPVTVDAGSGYDLVVGGDGADRLDGGSGVDEVYGGRGTDTLLGGASDDFLHDEDQTPGMLDCGPGADVLKADLGVDALIGCEQPPSEWGLNFWSGYVEHRFVAFRSHTRLTRLRVRALAGSTATVTCRGGGCPSQPQHSQSPAGLPIGTGPYRWGVLGRLAGRRLRPGAQVTVAIANPRFLTRVVQLTMRRRRAPARETHCVGPISGMVTHHCTSIRRHP
jgi:hypothetical protein